MAQKGYEAQYNPDWNAIDSNDSDEEDEVVNTALSFNDREKLNSLTNQIKEKFDFLEEDEIKNAILECDFDQEKLNRFFEKFEIDERYKDIDAFKWKTVEQKQFVNKKKPRGRGRGRGRQSQNPVYSHGYNQDFEEGHHQSYRQPDYHHEYEEEGYSHYAPYYDPEADDAEEELTPEMAE